MASRLPAIFAPLGLTLSDDECAFFRESGPAGFILFKRNCETPEQVRDLTNHFRELMGNDNLPILIDQEGGRVQRLGPPHWKARPAGARFGELWEQNPETAEKAIALHGDLIARELHATGVTVDCLPILDVARPETHDVIGDRAYSAVPDVVAALGRAVMVGLMRGGVLPVIKHIPGHGRGTLDSHHALPRVETPLETLQKSDFVPFKACSDAPFGMTAHIVYEAIDPTTSATLSPGLIQTIIRDELNFDGILMSDDLGMNALPGTMAERASGVVSAGCDLVLHCSGDMTEMIEVANALSPMDKALGSRLDTAMAQRIEPEPLDIEAQERMLSELLMQVGNI